MPTRKATSKHPTDVRAGEGHHRPPWRVVDTVVLATLGVAFGVVFWAWNLLWTATGPAFTAFPPAQAFMYGVWLLPGVLGMLVVRQPGAAVLTMLVASLVSALLGSAWGLQVVWYGVLEGLAPEIVFALFAYRRFGAAVATLAGAAAGLTAGLLDWFYYYRDWASGWVFSYVGVVVLSAAAVAGLGAVALVRALAATGVLDAFPAGRRRTLV